MRTPRPGYIFTPADCPNAKHPAEAFPEGECGLCGTNVKAYRFGYHVLPRLVGVTVLCAAIIGVVLLIGGCAAQPSPEEEFIERVRTVAAENGYGWSDDLEQATLDLGAVTCRDLEEGRTLDAIRDEVIAQAESVEVGRVTLAAVDAAPDTLCEER